MNHSVQEVRQPVRRAGSSKASASTSTDSLLVRSVPVSVVEQKEVAANLTDSMKVIAFLILAMICHYAATGTHVSPVDGAVDTSAEHGRVKITPDVDLMDLSTAGF